MSLGTILIIILIIFLLGGFSGRFGGYGYGMGHSGMGLGGVILIVLIILCCSASCNRHRPLKYTGLYSGRGGAMRGFIITPDMPLQESHFCQTGLY